jgi:hypothetical protein
VNFRVNKGYVVADWGIGCEMSDALVIMFCCNICCLVLGYVIGVSAIGFYGFKCNSLFTKLSIAIP